MNMSQTQNEESLMDPIVDLLQDWAPGRDQEEYVFHNKKATSWEKQHSGDKGFSKFISGRLTSANDILKKAYPLCQNRINKMTAGRKKHRLSYHPDKNFTDGVTVYVSTEAADEKKLTPYAVLDVLLGATTHEVAHILYTDFDKLAKSTFAHTILNIIEDERIEKLTCERWPGFSLFIQALKRYYFDFKYERVKLPSEASEIFDSFFKLVRYPKHLDIELVEKHFVFLSKIKAILSPYPETFDEAYTASHKIADLFERHLGEMPKNGDGGSGEEDNRTLTAKEIEKILDAISKQMKDLESGNNPIAQGEVRVSKSIEDIVKALEAHGQSHSQGNTIFEKCVPDKSNYATIKTEITPAARQLSRILFSGSKNYFRKETGLRNGNLDENRLAELVSGCSNTFFQNEFIEVDNDLVLAVMTDESGSMNGQKIGDAAKCNVIIREAIKGRPSALSFFYGYTSDHYSDGDNVITTYLEPGFNSPETLGSMSAKSGNCDAECVLAVAKRIREFTKKKCLLLIISDGLPVPRSGNFEQGIIDTRNAVEQISKQGFVPIQIGIGTDPAVQQKMFRHFITFESSMQMVKDLRKIIPKAFAMLKRAR